ncbi:MAG: methylmalonyl-CoA mutase family protein [Bacteroidales bacterium]|jgi:methylmalonyl-CoA mutase|nr:methylmalonyl-CoA mutase family protein [Bacteroidales bacterium]
MSDKRLFSEFPPVSAEQWEEQIAIDLKGADYDKKLVWRTAEGIAVRPYYRSEHLAGLEYLDAVPASFPYVRGKQQDTSGRWRVRQDIGVKEGQESVSNIKALDALAKGADEIGFSICGREKIREVNVPALLAGICSGAHPVHFYAGISALPVLESFLKDAETKKSGRNGVKGAVFFDPLGRLAYSGSFYGKSEFPLDMILQLFETAKDTKDFKLIGVEAAHFQNAGATLVQELAYALSMGAEYLTRLTDAGLKAEEVAGRIQFKFAIGSNYFMEIAKIRAMRLLWANIVKAYTPKEEAACATIHAETADWNITVYDPYVNLLRSTSETMSAAIAGVDSMTVQPFDSAFRRPDALSERIARNQQIILQEEAGFGKIVDPAAGSYYVENLTASMADHAWKLFLETDDKGGYLEAMKAGLIQAQVEESAAKRRAAVASRKEILLGTNQYANLKEEMKDRLGDAGCCSDAGNAVKIVPPLKLFRLGEPFEALRLRTENSGRRPKVFLLTVGHPVMRKARAGFALNFFSAAGFEVIDNNGFATVEEGVSAAETAKADIIVLCSSDEEYPALAPQAVAAAKGKGILVLAGFPKPIVEELKAAGIEHFIYAGQNVPEALAKYQQLLGL